MTPAEAAPLAVLIAAATGQRVAEGAADALALLLDDIDVADAITAVKAIARRPQPNDRRLTIDAPMIRAEAKRARAARIDQALATWQPSPAAADDPRRYLAEYRQVIAQAGDSTTPRQIREIRSGRPETNQRTHNPSPTQFAAAASHAAAYSRAEAKRGDQ